MLFMARREILPAVMTFAGDLASSINAIEVADVKPEAQRALLQQVNDAASNMSKAIDALAEAVSQAAAEGHADKKAVAYRDLVIPAMVALRGISDGIEPVIGADYWPLPTYADMLFSR